MVLMAGRSAADPQLRDLERVECWVVPDSWSIRMESFVAAIERDYHRMYRGWRPESYLGLVLLFLHPH